MHELPHTSSSLSFRVYTRLPTPASRCVHPSRLVVANIPHEISIEPKNLCLFYNLAPKKTSDFFIIWYQKTSDFFIKCTLKTSDFFKIIVSHHAFIQIKALSLHKISCTRQSESKFSLCSFALSLHCKSTK